MMPQRNDEALLAYLDGELDAAQRHDVEHWLAGDPAVRDRLAALAQSGDLLRRAYADIIDEPLPERLIVAARGTTEAATAPQGAEILVLKRPGRVGLVPFDRRWQVGLAAAAGLFGLIFGGAATYLGIGFVERGGPGAERQVAAAANNAWLDNAAGYYKLTVNAGDNLVVDVPAGNDPRE